MTAQQFVGLAIRLFAVWLVLTSIAYFTSIPAALASVPTGSETTASVAMTIGVSYVAAALLLWFFPMFVAHKLLPRTQHNDHLAFPARELARVGCCLLGLWLFAKAVPSMVWLLLRSMIMVEGSSSSFAALSSDSKLELAVAAFECVFAMLIVFRAGSFAKLISPGKTGSGDQ